MNMSQFQRVCAGKSVLFPLFIMLLALPVLKGRAETLPEKNLYEFYQQNCSGCHGVDGAAVDSQGKKLRGEDLTDAAWQRRTKDQTMVKAILKGIFFGWAMPAYKDKLTAEEAQRMVDIIRTAKKGQPMGVAAKVPDATK